MNRSFARKIGYLAAIAVLLVPISYLSQPATVGSDSASTTPGGYLAQLRTRYELSQANLGEIDPASESLKLAMVGMQGVAANILWTKAFDANLKQDWTTFQATLNQIVKLQPNFTKVWSFQAWNLSYNISVEFDDYRDRYRWVIKGIDFLKEGIRYNRHDPELLWYLGWIISHKIGRSDERVQFRRLFREDNEFHGNRPIAERDNWLVAKEWFRRAEDAVDNHNKPIRGRAPVVFYAEAPLCQVYYGIYLEDEGTFGEKARVAWQRAADDWHRFGARDIPSDYGNVIHLNDLELEQQRLQRCLAEFERLRPGVQREIYQAKYKRLPEADRALLKRDVDELTLEEVSQRARVEAFLEIRPWEIGEWIARLSPDKAAQAQDLAADTVRIMETMHRIEGNRETIDFAYWRQRCEAERTSEALQARENFFLAKRAFLEELDLNKSRRLYEEGFQQWEELVQKFPLLREDDRTLEDLGPVIEDYEVVLEAFDEKLPEDFVLNYVRELYDIWQRQSGATPQRPEE